MGERGRIARTRSVSSPSGAKASISSDAAPPSASSHLLRSESAPAPTPASGLSLKTSAARLPTRPSNQIVTMPSRSSTTRSADLETSGVVPEERIIKLRARWGIPSSDTLVRVFPCVYKKPRPSHGKMYIFPNHLVFLSHSHHTNICIPFAEVEQMQRKRHRILLITRDKTHRLRGSLTQNSTTYGVLLAVWQHARGDQTIDLESIRAGDKKLQKVIRKGERRASLTGSTGMTDTSEGVSEGSDYDEHDHDDEHEHENEHVADTSDDDEPALESHTIEPRWEIPLTPLDAAPPGFAASLNPPADASKGREAVTLSACLERCWHLLYEPDSQNMMQAMTAHQLCEITLGQWTPDSEPGVMTRIVKYNKPMQSRFVSGSALVEQTQKAALLTQPTKKVCIFQESRMQGVPYADSFVIHSVYELIEEAGERKTRVSITAWVVWVKSPPRLLRGKIERGSVAGVEESFKAVMAHTEAALLAQPQSTTSSSSAPSASSPQPSSTSSSTSSSASAAAATITTSSPSSSVPAPAAAAVQGVVAGAPTVVVAASPGVTVAPTETGSIHINEKYVYAVIAALLLSVIVNVLLAVWR